MPYNAAITRLESRALINLRGSADAQAAFSQALGCVIPAQPNTVSGSELFDILWLGPDEWLIVAAQAEEPRLQARLSDAATGLFAAVTPVSDQYAMFAINGPEAREIMVQGCGIDLHPGRFRPGQCARCGFARTKAIVQMLDASPVYRLFIESTYAHYMQQWFAAAAGAL